MPVPGYKSIRSRKSTTSNKSTKILNIIYNSISPNQTSRQQKGSLSHTLLPLQYQSTTLNLWKNEVMTAEKYLPQNKWSKKKIRQDLSSILPISQTLQNAVLETNKRKSEERQRQTIQACCWGNELHLVGNPLLSLQHKAPSREEVYHTNLWKRSQDSRKISAPKQLDCRKGHEQSGLWQSLVRYCWILHQTFSLPCAWKNIQARNMPIYRR